MPQPGRPAHEVLPARKALKAPLGRMARKVLSGRRARKALPALLRCPRLRRSPCLHHLRLRCLHRHLRRS